MSDHSDGGLPLHVSGRFHPADEGAWAGGGRSIPEKYGMFWMSLWIEYTVFPK
jgi:hypothetical protein